MNFDFSFLANPEYSYFILAFLLINVSSWLGYQVLSRFFPLISKIVIFILFLALFIALRAPLLFLTIPSCQDITYLANSFLAAGFVYLFFKLLDIFVFNFILKEKKHIYLPPLLHNIIVGVVYLIILFAFLRSAFDFSLTSILATSAVFSMVVGLALQDILVNLFGGIILSVERPFKIGDWVEINNRQGLI